MASDSSSTSAFGLWELDISNVSEQVVLSNAWNNSTHDNDIYEMPKNSHDFNVATHTSSEQEGTEEKCRNKIKQWLLRSDISESAYFQRRKTIEYLLVGIESLPRGYQSQDCARTWVVYWLLNSLYLLNADTYINEKKQARIINFLKKCQKTTGGFGGGPQQYAHVAASFGAVMALMTIGTPEAYDAIDRQNFYDFLLCLKQKDGSYSTQEGGEIDIRAIYCGLACAAILNILDSKLCENSVEWLNACQTYEGGFSQEPNDEAHGGYAYCGLATLIIFKKFLPIKDQRNLGINNQNISQLFDLNGLLRWSSMKQMSYSGGFCGRTHKLVDACYSFWVGSLFPMINIVETMDNNNNNNNNDNINVNESENKNNSENQPPVGTDNNKKDESRRKTGCSWLDVDNIDNNAYFDTLQLQKYLLIIAQFHSGGITDKPFKPADYYHTCYGLSGLSIAQHYGKVLGPKVNKLKPLDPVFGIVSEKATAAREYFLQKPRLLHQR